MSGSILYELLPLRRWTCMEDGPQKILIIEDEESLLGVLTDEFVEQGFSVSAAADGAEGLSRALRERPDVILLDILMPVMDGVTMLEWLRKESEWGSRVPVIILTNLTPSDTDGRSLSELYDEGVTAPNLTYLQKSEWTLNDVVQVVRDQLQPAV